MVDHNGIMSIVCSAHAEMIRTSSLSKTSSPGLLRTRGDDPNQVTLRSSTLGLLRTRGDDPSSPP